MNKAGIVTVTQFFLTSFICEEVDSISILTEIPNLRLPHFQKPSSGSCQSRYVLCPKETQSVNENFLPAAMFATESVLPGQAKPNSVDESDTKLGEIYKEITNPLKQTEK